MKLLHLVALAVCAGPAFAQSSYAFDWQGLQNRFSDDWHLRARVPGNKTIEEDTKDLRRLILDGGEDLIVTNGKIPTADFWKRMTAMSRALEDYMSRLRFSQNPYITFRDGSSIGRVGGKVDEVTFQTHGRMTRLIDDLYERMQASGATKIPDQDTKHILNFINAIDSESYDRPMYMSDISVNDTPDTFRTKTSYADEVRASLTNILESDGDPEIRRIPEPYNKHKINNDLVGHSFYSSDPSDRYDPKEFRQFEFTDINPDGKCRVKNVEPKFSTNFAEMIEKQKLLPSDLTKLGYDAQNIVDSMVDLSFRYHRWPSSDQMHRIIAIWVETVEKPQDLKIVAAAVLRAQNNWQVKFPNKEKTLGRWARTLLTTEAIETLPKQYVSLLNSNPGALNANEEVRFTRYVKTQAEQKIIETEKRLGKRRADFTAKEWKENVYWKIEPNEARLNVDGQTSQRIGEWAQNLIKKMTGKNYPHYDLAEVIVWKNFPEAKFDSDYDWHVRAKYERCASFVKRALVNPFR